MGQRLCRRALVNLDAKAPQVTSTQMHEGIEVMSRKKQ
jgi:hypothetical protein